MPDVGSATRPPSLSRLRRARWLRSKRRVAALSIAIVVLLALAVWLLFFSSVLAARTVTVVGLDRLSATKVEAAAEVPTGRPLARVDLEAVVARVENIPTVQSATASRSWPHTVEITVVERTPVAVVDRGRGLQDVDRYGVLFGHPRRARALPLIKASPGVGTSALADAGAVAGSLPPGLARKVQYLQEESADDIVLSLRDGRTVVWGSASDSAEKAEVASRLLRQKAVRVVDVSVPGRPATRS